MRTFDKRYQEYKVIRKNLDKECIDFLTEVAKAWNGKVFPLQTINREFDLEEAYCCIVYDGGNHPEYASNACSEVEGIFINKKGNLAVIIEDNSNYEIDRLDYPDLHTLAFAVDASVDFMLDQLITLIGRESTTENGRWTISRETWDCLVALANGEDDLNRYLDDECDDNDWLESLTNCYNPQGFVTLIEKVAEVGEKEVTWMWNSNQQTRYEVYLHICDEKTGEVIDEKSTGLDTDDLRKAITRGAKFYRSHKCCIVNIFDNVTNDYIAEWD